MHALSAAPLVGRGPSSSHALSGQQQQQLSLRETTIPYRRPASRGVLLKAGGSGRPEGSSLATSVWGVLPSALLPAGLEQRRPAADAPAAAADGATAAPLTVYCVRFTTGYARGAALSEPYSGVNVLLVGQGGRAVLQRVSPVNDPAHAAHQMQAICQVVDGSAGVDCTLVPSASAPSTSTSASSPATPTPASAPSAKVPQPKLRFLEGQVDEVSFLAPELGPLVGVLVGVEQGTWLLDEVTISSSRSAHIDRFVCREKIGVRTGEGATWLVPVPVGAYVYGSGESTVILTKEQASSLRAMDLAEYDDLKSRVLYTNLALAAGGAGVAGLAGGLDAAIPFAVGGAAGVVYQWLLQLGVDTAMGKAQQGQGAAAGAGAGGAESSGAAQGAAAAAAATAAAGGAGGEVGEEGEGAPPPRMADVVRGVASNPAVRLGFVAAVSLMGVSSLHTQGLVTQAVASCTGLQCMVGHASQEGIWKLFFGLLGFLTYKVALVGASIAPAESEATQVVAKSKQYEKY